MFFLIVTGIILTILGLLICLRYRNKYSVYRTFPADVLGYRTRNENVNGKEQEYFCVVVSYMKDGEDIHADYVRYVPAEKVPYKRGDKISIQVTPSSPKTFLYTEEVRGTSAFGAALVIGGLLTVIFHLLLRIS